MIFYPFVFNITGTELPRKKDFFVAHCEKNNV
jgi:hypothetical protein